MPSIPATAFGPRVMHRPTMRPRPSPVTFSSAADTRRDNASSSPYFIRSPAHETARRSGSSSARASKRPITDGLSAGVSTSAPLHCLRIVSFSSTGMMSTSPTRDDGSCTMCPIADFMWASIRRIDPGEKDSTSNVALTASSRPGAAISASG